MSSSENTYTESIRTNRTVISIPYSQTTNSTLNPTSKYIEPLKLGQILHGLFKIKNQTCECYFDGNILYWIPIESHQKDLKLNKNGQSVTIASNQISINNIHGVKLRCIKTVKHGGSSENRKIVKKTTTGLSIFCRRAIEGAETTNDDDVNINFKNNNKQGLKRLTSISSTNSTILSPKLRYQEFQIILELPNSHDICLEWGQKILASLSTFNDRPKSALILSEDGEVKNVIDYFFGRARIGYQFFALDSYGNNGKRSVLMNSFSSLKSLTSGIVFSGKSEKDEKSERNNLNNDDDNYFTDESKALLIETLFQIFYDNLGLWVLKNTINICNLIDS